MNRKFAIEYIIKKLAVEINTTNFAQNQISLNLNKIYLKVGSCSNNDNSVQIFFCPFLCSILIILFFESVAAEKTAKFC